MRRTTGRSGRLSSRWRSGSAAKAYRPGSRRTARSRKRLQQQRPPRPLREVEVVPQVAEQLGVLADGRARVGAAVRPRVEPRAAEEVVLDELQVRVEAQRLVVDDAAPRVRADHEPGD